MRFNKLVASMVFLFLVLSVSTTAQVSYGLNNNISASANASFLGEEGGATASQLGFLSEVGDFNNDGYNDFLMSMPYYGNFQGGAFLFYGSSNPETLWGIGQFVRKPAVGDHANHSWSAGGNPDLNGYAIAGDFDFNNDGYSDLVFGAPLSDDSGADAGEVHLILGGTYWDSTGQWQHSTTNATWQGAGASDELGRGLATGDFNNDGYGDFAMVAPEEDTGGNNAGTVYIVYGRQNVSYFGGGVSSPCVLTNSSCYNVTFYGEVGGDYLGTTNINDYASINGIGDYNNDGYDDLAVGAGRNDEGVAGLNTGQVYIVLGNNTWYSNSIGISANISFHGDTGSDFVGHISDPADVNNDGYDDFLIGVPNYNTNDEGIVYLIEGNAHNSMDTILSMANINHSFLGMNVADNLGYSVSLGYLDNDSFADVLIGAPNEDTGGAGAGMVYLILGIDYSLWGWNFLVNNSDASWHGENTTDQLGYYYGALLAKDINNDTFDDILVSAPFNDHPYSVYDGVDDGTIYMILGEEGIPKVKYCNDEYTVGQSWNVNTEVYCYDEVIPLSDNLNVLNNGNLIFSNVTLQVNNSVDGENDITINNGGRFSLWNDTEITALNTSAEYLIDVLSGSQFEMNNSRIEHAGWSIANSGLSIASDYANITNSNFTYNYNGLNVDSGADYLYFYNNIVADSDYIGLQLRADYATVESNIIYNFTDDGIELLGVTQSVFDSNNIYNGYLALGVAGSTFNNFTDNDLWNNSYSGMILVLSSDNNNISYNRIYDNIYGAGIAGSANTIEYNNISDNSFYGIIFNISASANQVCYNNIYNNKYGLYNINSTGTSLLLNDIYNNTVAGVYTDNLITITNMDIHDNAIGIQVNGTDIGLSYLYNFTITDSTNYEIDLINSDTIVLNVTFNKSNTNIDSLSSLNVTWYFYARVLDDFTFLPIDGANMLVYDFQNYPVGSPVYNVSTNSNGYIPTIILVEFLENSTIKLNYTPHTLITSKTFYITDTSNINMDTNKNVTILLELESQYQPTPTPERDIDEVRLVDTPANPKYQKYDPYAFHPEEEVTMGFSLIDIGLIIASGIGLSITSAYIVRRGTVKDLNKRVIRDGKRI